MLGKGLMREGTCTERVLTLERVKRWKLPGNLESIPWLPSLEKIHHLLET